MKLRSFFVPATAIAALVCVTLPGSRAFTLTGDSLGLDQRDFRVFNNFQDPEANDNTTIVPAFPGYAGAVAAIWKAHVEWGSELHGDGSGDPHQPGGLGSGGANFDNTFQGLATGAGPNTANTHSAIACSGGMVAFTESPGSTSVGWRIRYCENHVWSDGPGVSVPSGQFDLQGIAAHEIGHTLGLGHTSVVGATMGATIPFSQADLRSLHADDIAGIQAIYGAKSPTKPKIIGAVTTGGVLTLNGLNFASTGNEVWFTQAGSGGDGTPIKLMGVASTVGGTTIAVTPPLPAGPGDILVKVPGSSHASLSNAWPFDPSGAGGLTVTSIDPAQVDAVVVDGPALVTIHGTGFHLAAGVSVDGAPLAPDDFAVVSSSQIDFDMPLVSTLGTVSVRVNSLTSSATGTIQVAANDPPALDVEDSDPEVVLPADGLTFTLGTSPFALGIVLISPDLVPSTLPELFDLGIGNGLTTLFLLSQDVLDAKAWVQHHLPFGGVPAGTRLHLQGLSSAAGFPLQETGIQSITIGA